MTRTLLTLVTFLLFTPSYAQTEQEDKNQKDSLYIIEMEDRQEPDKVLHAEPLYIDLIRDLGARTSILYYIQGLL